MLDAGGLSARAELSLAQWDASLNKALGDLQRLDAAMQGVRSAKVSLDSQGLKQQTDAAKAQLDTINKTPIVPKVDTKELQAASQEFSTLRLRLSDLTNPAAALSSSFGAFGVGASAAAIGGVAALAALSVAAVKTATDLQAAVASVKAIAPQIDTTQVTHALNDMQTRVAQSSEQLGRSLYNVFSSIDVSQAQALALVEQFGRGAIAAETDAQTFGTAVLGVLNAYKLSTENAARVSDIFFNTVKAGVVTGAELAQGLGPVTAAAKAAGVSIEQLGALIAGVTKEGGPAAQNINNLTNILVKLASPETVSQLARLHIPLTDEAGGIRDVLSILADLKGVLDTLPKGEQASVLAQLFPDIQARQAAQTIISQLGFINEQLDINRTKTDSTAKAYEVLAGTAKSQTQLFGQAWSALLEDLGENILPGLTSLTTEARGVLGEMRTGIAQAQADLAPFIAALTAAAQQAAALRQQPPGAPPQTPGEAVAAAATPPADLPSLNLGPKAIAAGEAVADALTTALADALKKDSGKVDDAADNLFKNILNILAPEKLTAVLAAGADPNFDRFAKIMGDAGEAAALAFSGEADAGLRDFLQNNLGAFGNDLDIALQRLALAGQNGGEQLLKLYEGGIARAAPEVFQALADLKEQIATELAQGADFSALEAQFRAGIAASFGNVPPQIVDQMWAQIIGRSKALAQPGGEESGEQFGAALGKGAVEGVKGASQAVKATLDEIQRQVRLQPNLVDLTLKGTNPEDIARILAWKQANEEATQAISGLRDVNVAARAQVALNNDELSKARDIALQAAAAQDVLNDRYGQLASAALPGLTAAQAELVKQLQLAHDPAAAAGVAVSALGGSAAEAGRALAGTGADVAQYVQHLQRLAETADPAANAQRAIGQSAHQALDIILQSLPQADRAWEDYRAAREGDAAALQRLASQFGIDPAAVQAALAGSAQALQDFEDHLKRIVNTADPVANANKQIEASAKSMLSTLEAGLPAADRAWLDFVAAREGDQTTLRALYAQMGGDLAAFDNATEQQQKRLIDNLAKARAAFEEFTSTGRIPEAALPPPDARTTFSEGVTKATEAYKKAREQLVTQMAKADEDYAHALTEFAQASAKADAEFVATVAQINATLAQAQADADKATAAVDLGLRAKLSGLADDLDKLNAQFAKQQAEQGRQQAEQIDSLLRGYQRAVEDAQRQINQAITSGVEAQRQALIQLGTQLSGLHQQALQSAVQASQQLDALRQQALAPNQTQASISAQATQRIQLEAQIGLSQQAAAQQENALKVAFHEQTETQRRQIAEQTSQLVDGLERQRADIQRQIGEAHDNALRQSAEAQQQHDEQVAAIFQQAADAREDAQAQFAAIEKRRQDAAKQAKEALDRAKEQHQETLSRLIEQVVNAANQHRETINNLNKQLAEQEHQFFDTIDRLQQQLEVSVQQVEIGRASYEVQRDSHETLQEIAAKLKKGGIEQNFAFQDMVVVEPATEFMQIAAAEWKKLVAAGAVG